MNIGFWLKEGFFHILDIDGFDHILFLTATLGFFLFQHWKKVIYKLSIFTLGHTISLIWVGFNGPLFSILWIEVLILLTIFFTGLIKILEVNEPHKILNYGAILVFGLIHGMGFAKQWVSIFPFTEIGVGSALFLFNVGIELAQIICAMVFLALNMFLFRLKLKPSNISKFWGFLALLTSMSLLFQIFKIS